MAENQKADVELSISGGWERKSWLPEVPESMSLNRLNAVLNWSPQEDVILKWDRVYIYNSGFASRNCCPWPSSRRPYALSPLTKWDYMKKGHQEWLAGPLFFCVIQWARHGDYAFNPALRSRVYIVSCMPVSVDSQSQSDPPTHTPHTHSLSLPQPLSVQHKS